MRTLPSKILFGSNAPLFPKAIRMPSAYTGAVCDLGVQAWLHRRHTHGPWAKIHVGARFFASPDSWHAKLDARVKNLIHGACFAV
jgi:hypothetical protein